MFFFKTTLLHIIRGNYSDKNGVTLAQSDT